MAWLSTTWFCAERIRIRCSFNLYLFLRTSIGISFLKPPLKRNENFRLIFIPATCIFLSSLIYCPFGFNNTWTNENFQTTHHPFGNVFGDDNASENSLFPFQYRCCQNLLHLLSYDSMGTEWLSSCLSYESYLCYKFQSQICEKYGMLNIMFKQSDKTKNTDRFSKLYKTHLGFTSLVYFDSFSTFRLFGLK